MKFSRYNSAGKNHTPRAHVAKQIKDAGSAGARSEQASQSDSFAPRAKRDSRACSARERLRTPICAVATCAALALLFVGLTVPSAYAGLPDGRAYEQVSTLPKGGQDAVDDVQDNNFLNQVDATHAGFLTYGPLPSAPSGQAQDVLATRTPSGWRDQNVTPPDNSSIPSLEGGGYLTAAISTDFGSLLYWGRGSPLPGGQGAGGNDQRSIYLGNSDRSFTWVSAGVAPYTSTVGTAPVGSPAISSEVNFFQGANPDLSHVLFGSVDRLLPDNTIAPAEELFDWVGGESGHLVVAGVLPDGSLDPAGAFLAGATQLAAGGHGGSGPGAVSNDGSKVFFESDTGTAVPPTELYVRENAAGPSPSTRLISSVGGDGLTPAPDGATFQAATPDGSKAFFTSADELTPGSTSGGGLYLYDFGTESLRFLTPDSVDPGGAQVSEVASLSTDGSHLYFTAKGVLAANHNENAEAAQAGDENLYVYEPDPAHPGQYRTVFIADLLSGGTPQIYLTPDGSHMTFVTKTPLQPGYDSNGFTEIYAYDAESGTLACASCNPSGAPATGDAGFSATSTIVFPGIPASAIFTAPPQRAISDDGDRVFFDSPDPLVPQAHANGTESVYEYVNGAPRLISSGAGSDDSYLEGISASGNDAFFFTRDRLVPSDTDHNFDLYDARVGGGFSPVATPTPCSGDACQGSLSAPPSAPSPASAGYSGSGNVRAMGGGKVHKPKRHPKKPKKRHAKVNRGAGK